MFNLQKEDTIFCGSLGLLTSMRQARGKGAVFSGSEGRTLGKLILVTAVNCFSVFCRFESIFTVLSYSCKKKILCLSPFDWIVVLDDRVN